VSVVDSYRIFGLLLLGALHGINPGMGWLFAVARGFQEGSRRAVWGSLGPLAAGHALAIAAAMAVAAMLGAVVPIALLRFVVGAGLLARGIASLVRHRHPRGGGMQLNRRELTWWSFLMATAHGAGLMALPLVLPAGAREAGAELHAMHGMHAMHDMHGGAQMSLGPGLEGAALIATVVHAAGYLIVTALVAVVVYERVGVRMLRSAWINMDLLWSGALVVTGVATLVI
jgi:hypothetical protein